MTIRGPHFTVDRVLADKRLLGAALVDAPTWQTWRTVLKAAFGLSLNRDEARAFASVAGSRQPPSRRVRELWSIIGRRGGKSRMAAALAVYVACFGRHKLARGEIGMVLVLAASRDQAKTVFEYVRGFLEASPILSKEIANITATDITLRNGIVIAVHSNSFRTVRGRTLIAAILDEVSFWRDESSALPDVETYRAILPSLATTNGMLIGISTPYRKLGLLHQKHRDFFGVDSDDVLVVQGGTQTFNPTLSDQTLAAQRQADPTAAMSEWDAEFRTDLSSFLDDQLIDAAVEHGRPLELPPIKGTYLLYRAFCDASGGTGRDAYTIAIGHKQDELFVIDALRGTSGKFDPQQVTRDYVKLLKDYGCSSVTGDNYAAEWVAGAWRDNTGITYIKSDVPKSQIYLECIPLFTRGLVRLPDHSRLLRELRLLERQTHRGGKDSVDHPRGGHDDYANAVCGVLHGLSLRLGYDTSYRAFMPDYTDSDARAAPAEQPPPANHRAYDYVRAVCAANGLFF
jgi:Phage Terminase